MEELTSPPFSTQNQQLAFALMLAGCQFAGWDNGGPAQNLYTIGFLRARKIGVGQDIETAAIRAVEAKIPGIVTYFFQRTKTLEDAIAAWDLMVDEFRKAEADERPPITPDVSTAATMQVLFIRANSVKEFQKLPFMRPALVSNVQSTATEEPRFDGTKQKPAGASIISGKGQVWSLGASRETKNHLNV